MFQKILISVLLSSLSAFANFSIPSPTKYLDPELKYPAPKVSRFSAHSTWSGDFVEIKKAEWEACRQHRREVPSTFAAAHDPLKLFLEEPVKYETLEQMETQNLKAFTLPQNPWSGDFWAYARGLLAARFQDQDFMNQYEWIQKYQYVQSHPASQVISEKGQDGVRLLSVAEKYDLLTGNSQGLFTASQWEQGKEYYDQSGNVEGWMGICHGWAPAAIMEPRPAKSVDAKSLDGKWNLHFNPSEVKGLLSYSWATNSFPVVTLGQRCNEKNPKRDANGRFVNPECFDINPATWHLAMVHRLGVDKTSFVMDATYDYEVWNQPVIGYSYSYFNPMANKPTSDLQKAKVQRTDFAKDPYLKYRSPNSTSLVGIEMKVGYIVETSSNDEETDSPDQDIVRWVRYTYDLELDNKGKIIGGEWHSEAHPDFIWTPKKGARPMSQMDYSVMDLQWENSETIPESWAKAAQLGSAQGWILNAITEGIVRRSVLP